MSSRSVAACFALLALFGCKRKPDVTALAKDDGKGKTQECRLVAGGRITKDTVIEAGCQVTVGEPYAIVEGANLKIEAGARLAFKKGARLVVEDGSLTAVGEKMKPVTFTSAEPAPAAGDWGGIAFIAPKPSQLQEVVVEWAGEAPKPPASKSKAPPTKYGIIGAFGGARVGSLSPLADRSPGLYVGPDAKVSLVASTVRHSKKVGIAADGDAPFEKLENVTLDDNGGYAMDVKAAALGAIGSLTASEPVRIRGSVNASQSWPTLDLVVASLEVVATEPGGAIVLTLGPESIVRVEPKTSLRIGGYAEGGAIAAKKVRFTSASPKPAPGDWAGIHFQKRAPGTVIDECIVEFAGYEDPPPPSTTKTKPSGKGKEKEKPRPKPSALVILEWMKDFQVTRTTFRSNAGPGMGKPETFLWLLGSGTGGCEGLDAPKLGNKSIGQPLCEYHEDELAKSLSLTLGALGSDPDFDSTSIGVLGKAGSGYGGGGMIAGPSGGAVAGPGGGGLGGISGVGKGGGAGSGGGGSLKTKPGP
ncbi:MAG: hypothetical protein HYV09_04215 [Deltaproteobacteria bacterium]|nr:hypothetical protein [Deltaproteobacteria bacterium]